MLRENEFHACADATIERFFDSIEKADANGVIECELQGGILTLAFKSGKHIVVSKHAPSKQLWLSSPIQGGLHFSYDADWRLPDGRTLAKVLASDIAALASFSLTL